MTALDHARERMATTGMDGYTLAVLMQCEPKCWQDVRCTTCGREKHRNGRAEADGAYLCEHGCPGYLDDPKPPHLFGADDSTRCYTDLIYDLRCRRGEFDEPDEDEPQTVEQADAEAESWAERRAYR